MVLVAQSDSTEDSQGRQIRVNKKLSKAISAVPRSRFQKARPVLPSSKRPEKNPAPPKARQPVEPPSSIDVKNTTSVPQTEETSSPLDVKSASVPQAQEISVSLDVKNTFVQQSEEISSSLHLKNTSVPQQEELTQNGHETDIAVIDESKTPEKEDSNNSEILEVSSGNEPGKEIILLNKNVSLTKEDNIHENADDEQVISTNCDSTSLPNADNTSISTSCNIASLSNAVNASISTSCNITSLSNVVQLLDKENENNTTPSLTQESPPEKDSENNLNRPISSQAPAEQERTDNTITTPPTADKSSKYPHLTSILLKKRSEPRKENQQKRRKKLKKDVPLERSKMTMADLIYWNPTDPNPSVKSVSTVEEAPISENEEEDCPDGELEENNAVDTVPKLVISEDGRILIDESSLVVSRNRSQLKTTKVVMADETTYSSFRKRPLTKHWTAKDTTIFYKALSLVGTDFALMEQIFPHRTRRELKHKFKREEKQHIDLINRAMYESQLTFDAGTLDELIQHLNSLSNDAAQENLGDSSGKAKKKQTSNRKKNTSSTDEYLPSETGNKGNKRKRKAKTLPNDSDENEDLTEISPEETNVNDGDKKGGNKRKRKAKNLPNISDEDEGITEISPAETNVNGAGVKEKSNKRKRKTKKLPEDFVDINDDENIGELISEETISYNAPQREVGSKKKKTKTLKENVINIDEDMNSAELVTEDINCTSSSEIDGKKKRMKPKKLPDDFIDSSVIEDITELVQEEINKNDTILELTINTENNLENDSSELATNNNTENNLEDDSSELTINNNAENNLEDDSSELTINNNTENNLEDDSSSAETQMPEVCSQVTNINDESSLNQENCSDTNDIASHLSLASNSETVEYVTIEYIENAESVVEPAVLNNVMAYEVVSSEKPGVKRKRKNFKPIIPKRKQETVVPVLLSSTNYTPA